MKCVLILCVLFSAAWGELSKQDILTVFYSRCDNTVNTINQKIANLIRIPAKGVKEREILKPQGQEEKKQDQKEEKDEKGAAEDPEGAKKEGAEANGPDPDGAEPEKPQEPEQYNATYYCSLTKMVRIAPDFKLTGLMYYQHPPTLWYPPINDVAKNLQAMLTKYNPVGTGVLAHYPIGCEVQISTIKRKIPIKKKGKKKKKKGKKFNWQIIPQYRLNCLALTGEFVVKFLTEFALSITLDLEPITTLVQRYKPE
ncbi:unnamed protein product [Cylicocyclus nassatus]|uniref:Uncharacterized protein n=1 Tax=Cylicocyclus nassatus TaxID=53992 RepID=A0AA36DQE1_CYLNA|nr:unnamed protein product [Cylicocyclus nassatus]